MLTPATEYEWCVEIHSTEPDTGETLVEHHDWQDSFRSCVERIASPCSLVDPTGIELRYAIVLVKRSYRSAAEWVYLNMDTMTLPEHFSDCLNEIRLSRVPKRFHAEVAKASEPHSHE